MRTRRGTLPCRLSARIPPPGVGSCWCCSQSLMWHFSNYYYFSLAFFSLCYVYFFLIYFSPASFLELLAFIITVRLPEMGIPTGKTRLSKQPRLRIFSCFLIMEKPSCTKKVIFSCSLPLGILLNWFLLSFYRWDIPRTIELILVLSSLI